MRKEPIIQPPDVLNAQPREVITQRRSYKLITPLYGGGVTPTASDPVTVVRATEIRGQLRFWWRATRGGQWNGDTLLLRAAEDTLWGKAYTKGDPLREQHQTIQLHVEIDPARPGEPVQPFTMEGRRLRAINHIPAYAAFPLQPDQEEQKKTHPAIPWLLKDVHFTLTITYPRASQEDVEAALWAWETFGGIGARTRRGFGAVHLLKVNNIIVTSLPFSRENIVQWLAQELSRRVTPGPFPADLPNLGNGVLLATRPAVEDANRAWNDLIRRLQAFRQARDQHQHTQWPEAKAIRALTAKQAVQPTKFPRAALGLPIIFHFKEEAGGPPDTTLNEAVPKDQLRDEATPKERVRERFASPLILRPLLCRDQRAVGLALVLAGSRANLQDLVLEEKDTLYQVEGTLTPREARQIPVLQGETDVLQAFIHSL